MIKSFLLGIVSVLGLLMLITFMLPSDYKVEAEVTIEATPKEVFPHINTLRLWESWAFAEMDSSQLASIQYKGIEEGVGSLLTWDQGEQGNGRLEIVTSIPYEKVEVVMSINDGSFVNQGTFILTPSEEGTKLLWEEKGDFGFNLLARGYALLSDFDENMKAQYTEALKLLKNEVEQKKESEQ
ncbi:SRPBCC family protein [Algivirga pacifica]|uniref:Polyketide cyclase / dehydrase and lipid transport n=1 Tax=Algivirga pacifica TaxID=1162670 RepID=A0ABP9D8C7_9BACT